MWNNVINAWWPLVLYPATDAPRFTKGMWAMIGTAIVTLIVTAMVYRLEQREKRQRWVARVARGELENEKDAYGQENRKEMQPDGKHKGDDDG